MKIPPHHHMGNNAYAKQVRAHLRPKAIPCQRSAGSGKPQGVAIWAHFRSFPQESSKAGSLANLRDFLYANQAKTLNVAMTADQVTDVMKVAVTLLAIISSRVDTEDLRDLAAGCEAFRECCRILKCGNAPTNDDLTNDDLINTARILEARMHSFAQMPRDPDTQSRIRFCHSRMIAGIADLDRGIDRYENFLKDPNCIFTWMQFPHFETLCRELNDNYLIGNNNLDAVLPAIEIFCLASPRSTFERITQAAQEKSVRRGNENWQNEYFYVFTKLMEIFGSAIRRNHPTACQMLERHKDLLAGDRVSEIGSEAIGFYLEVFPQPRYDRRFNPTQYAMLRHASRAYNDRNLPLHAVIHGAANLASSLRHRLRTDWAIELFYADDRIRPLLPHRPDTLAGSTLLRTDSEISAARKVLSRLIPERKAEVRDAVTESDDIFDPHMNMLPDSARPLVDKVIAEILGSDGQENPLSAPQPVANDAQAAIDAAITARDPKALLLIENLLQQFETSAERHSIAHANLLQRYAIVLGRTGRTEEAEQAELQAAAIIQSRPEAAASFPIVLLNLGETYLTQGQLELAERTLLSAERYAKGLVHFEEGKFPIFHFALHLRLARCLARALKYEEADRRLSCALDFYGQYQMELADQIGKFSTASVEIFLSSQRYREALPFLDRLATFDPRNAAAGYKIIMVDTDESEDYETAITAAEKGLALYRSLLPQQLGQIETICQTLANIHTGRKDWAKALPYAEEAQRIRLAQTPSTNTWWHQIFLTDIYFGVRRRQDAITLLQKLAKSLDGDREDKVNAIQESIERHSLQQYFPNFPGGE